MEDSKITGEIRTHSYKGQAIRIINHSAIKFNITNVHNVFCFFIKSINLGISTYTWQVIAHGDPGSRPDGKKTLIIEKIQIFI